MSKQPIVLAITSDIHVGSTLAMVPPEGVTLDDGGTYQPSKAQRWQWECWEDFWSLVGTVRKRHKAALYNIYNGDLFEGDHHGTPQLVSRNPESASYLADRIFGVPLALSPERQFIVRGTEAHVGPSGASEEAFGRHIKAERGPENRWSWWHLRLPVNGIVVDFQHHPGTRGGLPWTAPQAAQRLAFWVWSEHHLHGDEPPALAIRSHTHVHRDSFDAYPTRAIITPAWQLKTAHAHKVAANSLADIGGLIVVVEPDGSYEVTAKTYKVALPPLWSAA